MVTKLQIAVAIMICLPCLICCRQSGPPFSPKEALKTFKIEPGFRIETFATEPAIVDPVAMDFDEYGRIYVVENSGYPLTTERAVSKVKLLEDTNGDGLPDRATLFVDQLVMPTGVLCWKKGILVTDAPHVWYFRDSDGDGKADQRSIVLTGFAFTNPQHTVNNPIYGLDNWIYLAHEGEAASVAFKDKFGELEKGIRFPDRSDIAPLNSEGRNIRFKPDQHQLETLSGSTQFGHSFDEWGHHFLVRNSNHGRHEVIATRYLKRNPDLPVASSMQDMSNHGDAGQVFPITAGGRRELTDMLWGALGEFTSACSLTVYLGGAFPQAYHGSVFVGEPANNLVHQDLLVPSGASFVTKRAREGAEFLASSDSWFRPANFTIGPDGALYVVDYYRPVLEHPEYMSTERRHDTKALYVGNDKGRIYRIVPDSNPPSLPKNIRLGDFSDLELVQQLGNSNLWWRRTAQRLLIDRKGTGAVPDLIKLFEESPSALARLHSLWTLEGLGKLDPALVERALNDDAAGVRENAIILAESWLRSPFSETRAAGGSGSRPLTQPSTTLSRSQGKGVTLLESPFANGPQPKGSPLASPRRREGSGERGSEKIGDAADPAAPSPLAPLPQMVARGDPSKSPLAKGGLQGGVTPSPPKGERVVEDRVRGHDSIFSHLQGDRHSGIFQKLLTMVKDPNPRMRFQLLCTLGEISSAAARTARDQLLFENLEDRWMQVAALSTSSEEAPRLFRQAVSKEGILGAETQGRLVFLQQACSAIANRGKEHEIQEVLTLVAEGAVAKSNWWRSASLDGLASGLRGKQGASIKSNAAQAESFLKLFHSPSDAIRRSSLRLLEVVGLRSGPSLTVALHRAAAAAENVKMDPNLRVDSIGLLKLAGPGVWESLLRKLVNPKETESVQAAAVNAMGVIAGQEVGSFLISKWKMLAPSARSEAADALLADADRSRLLAAALQNGDVPPWSLSYRQKSELLRHNDPAIRSVAGSIYEGEIGRSEVLVKRYEAATRDQGNAIRGQAVFKKTCSKCHKLGNVRVGEGGDAGPDLATIRNHPKQELLMHILMPNKSIAQNYETYIVRMRTGQIRDGVLGPQSPTTITLRHDDGTEELIQRKDIEQMRLSDFSIMPGDLDRQIDVNQMTDLLEFIASAR